MPTLKKIKLPKNEATPLGLRDLIQMHDANFPKYNEICRRMEENERLRRVKHWSDDESKNIENDGRQAYSIGFLTQKENFVVEKQKQNRTDFKVKATIDPNDEVKAAIANIQFRDFEKRTNFKYLESDCFDSGLTVAFGAYEIGLGFDDQGNEVPIVDEIDYKDLIWDYNSRKYEGEDCLFMAKRHRAYRYQLINDYGNELRNITQDGGFGYKWGRAPETYYVSKNKDGKSDHDLLTVFHHYQKVKRKIYYVYFNDYANLAGLQNNILALKTSDKKEADKKFRELNLLYIRADLPRMPNNTVISLWEDRIDKYEFTYEKILEYEQTDLPFFKFSKFHSFFLKGEFWTLTDILKDIQTFVDRYIAQIDYSLGKDIKDTLAVNVSKLAEGYKIEDVVKAIEESGIIPVRSDDAVKNLRGSGANPQYLKMVEWMKSALEDLAGGRAFQGLSEGSKEPGIALQIKKEQGERLAFLPLDNLRRTKLDLGKKLLWYFKNYDTSQRIIEVAGGELSPAMLQLLQLNGIYAPSQVNQGEGFLKINSMFHLKDAPMELTVTESRSSETQKERRLGQLIAIGQTNPLWQTVPQYNELLLENFDDLDFETRNRLMIGYQQALEAQAQAAEREQNRQDEEVNIKKSETIIKAKGNEKAA